MLAVFTNSRGALAALVLLQGIACAQKPASQQNLTFNVVNARVTPLQPVTGVQISITYLDGSTRITDTRDLTNRQGQVFLRVTTDALERDLRVEVACRDAASCAEAKDLVIFQPADGQLPSALPPAVTIQLLPKGSPALLGPAQIEAILHRALLQLNSVENQNRALRQQVAENKSQQRDLSKPLAEWASANGFTPEEANQHVQEWAQLIQAKAARASEQQKALAELALKHYGAAAQLFVKAEDAAAEDDPEEAALMKKVRARSRDVLRNAAQAAGAFQLNLQYHEATAAMERALDHAAAMHKKYPEDVDMYAVWVETSRSVAGARVAEGSAASPKESLALLMEAAKVYEGVAAEYQKNGLLEDWAAAEDSLGMALWSAGNRSPADQAMGLLDQSIQAYRHALEVRTQAAHPQEWGDTESNLAVALTDEAALAAPEKAGGLLDQAVQGFAAALQVSTKAAQPQQWALDESNLGAALFARGKLVPGDQGLAAIVQAAQAMQGSLEVYTRADQPQDWARVNNELGVVLMNEGERLPSDKAVPLYEQAAQALKNALEVRTMASLPQDWARTENNLGAVLDDLAKITPDQGKAFALFAEAGSSYKNALKIYTKADLPQSWAGTENNVGVALYNAALRAPAEDAMSLLTISVQAYEYALEVYTKDSRPQAWAMVQDGLALAFDSEGRYAAPDKAAGLFEQAAQAYRNEAEVNTKAARPWDWANAERHLGSELWREAQVVSADKVPALLDQAVQAEENALEGYGKADRADWGTTQSNLAMMQAAQGNYAAALRDSEAAVEVRPGDLSGLLRVAEANLMAGHADVCLKQVAAVGDAQVAGGNAAYLPVRESVKLACEWGAGDKGAALATEKTLPARTSQVVQGWNSSGLRRFFETSASFAGGREGWIALFVALQQGDGAGMVTALQKIEPLMQN